MPGRKYSSGKYRYGFNGKESDNEVKGDGNQVDYEARRFENRIGRFLSLDPLQKKYPNESNYVFVGNSPLLYKDVNGEDKIVTITFLDKDGRSFSIKMTDPNHFEYSPGHRFGKLSQPFKSDLQIDIIIDYSKSAIGALPKMSFSTSKVNPKDISYYEYSKLSDFLSNLFNEQQGRSEKIGFQFLASGDDKAWNEGLPKSLPGSESLNMKNFLLLASGLTGSNAELDEKVVKLFTVTLLDDKVEKIDRLAKSTNLADNVAKLHGVIVSLIEMYSQKPPASNNNANTNQIEPGKSNNKQVIKILPSIPGLKADTIEWLYTPYGKPDTLYKQPVHKQKSKSQ